jgi:hypothetical protein
MTSYLNPTRIEYLVTYHCNSNCKHCQLGFDKRHARPAAIDTALAVRVIHEVARAWNPSSLMTFGGEPLLYLDTVCAIHAAARECGISQRQVITNAGFPRSAPGFTTAASRLAESGVNRINISVDAFHEESIPVELVERNAGLLLEAGIPDVYWNPCWVIAPEAANPWNERTHAILAELSHLGIRADEGNILQPVGNACNWLAEYLPERMPIPPGTCGDMPYTTHPDKATCISVNPDGSVIVCNRIAHAGQPDLFEALRDYDPYRDPGLKAVMEGGMPALLDLARSHGVSPDPLGYYNVCEMCSALRRALNSSPSDPASVNPEG